LEEHKLKTIPVIQKYKEVHDVAVINGEGDFETVFCRIAFVVEDKLKNFA
jgi:adenylate kinase